MTARPFGLRDDPFVERHDPRLVHAHRTHREAVERLARAFAQHAPFAWVDGASGSGKTTVLRATLASGDGLAVAEVTATPALGIAGLRAALLAALGATASASEDATAFAAALAGRAADAPAPVLAIDEAHELSDATLVELRLLSNLEVHGRKAVCVVLAGGPALAARLDRPEHQALRQRIGVRVTLAPLSARETEAMLHHRVAICGGAGALLPRVTCRAIHALTHGVPRETLAIAGEAMALAHAEGAAAVDASHVAAAARALGFRSVADAAPEPAPESAEAETMEAEAPATRAVAPVLAMEPAPPRQQEPAPPAATATPEPAPEPVATDAIAAKPAPEPAAAPVATAKPAARPLAATAGAPASPAVEDWLARFRDPNGPPRIGARVAAVEPTLDLAHVRDDDASLANEDAGAEDAIAPAPPDRRRRRPRGRVVGRGPLRPSRHARRSHTGLLVGSLALVAITGAGLLWRSHPGAFHLPDLTRVMSVATRPHASTPAPAPAATMPPAASTVSSAPVPSVVPLAPRVSAASPASAITRVPLPTPPAAATVTPAAPRVDATTTAAVARPDSAAAPRRYLIVVATYLAEERAREERDHIATLTSLGCHVIRGHEDGAEVFRIMLGPLPTRREAESEAEQLFATGAVSETRVVRWFGGDLGPR